MRAEIETLTDLLGCKGRSRLDQLERKKNSKGAKIASITADEFQSQFKKLRRKMTQFWAKEDKVA